MIRQLRCLSLAACALLTSHDASAWRIAPPNVYVIPSSPARPGQQVTIGVRSPASGTTYRYVATMGVTGAGRQAVSVGCALSQTIGTGGRVTWRPHSGLYRLTVYSASRLTRDSTSISYQVNAPNAGWLNIGITQIPNPSPPGSLTLQLSTNDRGAGYGYQWVARLQSVLGASGPGVTWNGDSPGPTVSVPLIQTPGHYNVTARVGVYQGNPCQIIETSSGTLTDQVIR